MVVSCLTFEKESFGKTNFCEAEIIAPPGIIGPQSTSSLQPKKLIVKKNKMKVLVNDNSIFDFIVKIFRFNKPNVKNNRELINK